MSTRVLQTAGLLAGHSPTPTKKGSGFVPPLRPHEHWPVDVSYRNIAGTCYVLDAVRDGCRRFIVPWEIRANMAASDLETISQRGREQFADAQPRIISDNGPQFVATASSAGGRATPWTCGRTPRSRVSTMRSSICASVWASPERNWRRHRRGTGKRKP